jgi:hypothetical protein
LYIYINIAFASVRFCFYDSSDWLCRAPVEYVTVCITDQSPLGEKYEKMAKTLGKM